MCDTERKRCLSAVRCAMIGMRDVWIRYKLNIQEYIWQVGKMILRLRDYQRVRPSRRNFKRSAIHVCCQEIFFKVIFQRNTHLTYLTSTMYRRRRIVFFLFTVLVCAIKRLMVSERARATVVCTVFWNLLRH